MGLDMYLSVEKYVGGWDHGSVEEKEQYRKILDVIRLAEVASKDTPSLDVKVRIAYKEYEFLYRSSW